MAQGAEVEHHPQGLVALPTAHRLAGSKQLPALPAAGHQGGRQGKALEGRQRQGGTAEGGLVQVSQLVHQPHRLTRLGQQSGQFGAGGAAAHHQHITIGVIGSRQTATGWRWSEAP